MIDDAFKLNYLGWAISNGREGMPDFKSHAAAIDVKYVAGLARLHLKDDEVSALQGQLEHIVAFVNQLTELDVSSVEPTAHARPVQNVFRADEPRSGLDHETVMRNAPVTRNGQFVVPRIME
jgi:aspartyl-tRNA(Asn)/glutamyl-tRNA(Gln) amidotransferase subunit C